LRDDTWGRADGGAPGETETGGGGDGCGGAGRSRGGCSSRWGSRGEGVFFGLESFGGGGRGFAVEEAGYCELWGRLEKVDSYGGERRTSTFHCDRVSIGIAEDSGCEVMAVN
jgi:hypothetical protein